MQKRAVKISAVRVRAGVRPPGRRISLGTPRCRPSVGFVVGTTLRSVAGQQQRVMEYADKLSAQEGKLVSLRDQQNELRLQKDKLQKELNTLMETLKF